MDNITPRDLFAAAALQGMLSHNSNDGNWGDDYRTLAEHAFDFAHEMMDRRDIWKQVEKDVLIEKYGEKWEPILSALSSPMLASDWYDALKDKGLSRATFFRYLDDMKDAGLVEMNPEDKKYEKTENK